MTRFAAKTDKTHAEVRETLRACGFVVLDTSRFPGFVDMLVREPDDGPTGGSRMWLIEAKTPQNKAGGYAKTAKQSQLEKAGWEIVYLTSASEALAWAKEAA